MVFIITAWFSVGYNQFDEHFQILEFAGLKLGITEKANLPWEYQCMMRPALQPLVVYCIYKAIAVTGVTSPFIMAFFIRLFSAILTLVSIHLVIRLYAPGISNRKLLYAFLILSFFLWFVPYNSVRFASETVAGRVFLIGLAWFFLRKKLNGFDYLITGLLLGVSFITRYQVAFMILGFAAWLAFIQKAGFRNLLLFTTGIILATALGVLIDRWYYGAWVITSWNYFLQNILLGKASGFGISPWWFYVEQTFMNAIPPLSLVYILAVFLYFIYFPKDILTWTMVPFLAMHFLIPHKELRFIYPIIGFLPVMLIRVAGVILQKKGFEVMGHRITKIAVMLFWGVNFLMVVILAFRPADVQIALFQKLWNDYPMPARLYFTGDNPYYRANADICFYKRKTLTFQHVDSLGMVIPPPDTICLILSDKPGLQAASQFRPVLIFSTLPPWVRHFNVNHWIERTSFWYIYELRKIQPPNNIP
jgi:phosphatidylinositol glycan class B